MATPYTQGSQPIPVAAHCMHFRSGHSSVSLTVFFFGRSINIFIYFYIFLAITMQLATGPLALGLFCIVFWVLCNLSNFLCAYITRGLAAIQFWAEIVCLSRDLSSFIVKMLRFLFFFRYYADLIPCLSLSVCVMRGLQSSLSGLRNLWDLCATWWQPVS